MKRTLLMILVVALGLSSSYAEISLTIRPLSGDEVYSVLSRIGKVVYSDESLIVYDSADNIIYRASFNQVQHLRYGDDINPGDGTGVESAPQTMQVVAYPNPTADILNVKNAEGNVIRIYSFEGRLVQTVAVVDGQAFIDMSVYSSGTYILVSGTQVFNVIKK